MRAVFERAKVILDGEDAFLCIGIPYRDAKKFVGEMKPRKYVAEIKEHRNRRSLDANAYCFVLIDKIAQATGVSKVEVYREAIKGIGGNSEIVCVQRQAAKALKDGWSKNGLGWVAEEFPSKIDGCVNVRLFFGSSTYDSKQMSLLIDHVVQDAKALGIETLPPHKLRLLEDEWDAKTV